MFSNNISDGKLQKQKCNMFYVIPSQWIVALFIVHVIGCPIQTPTKAFISPLICRHGHKCIKKRNLSLQMLSEEELQLLCLTSKTHTMGMKHCMYMDTKSGLTQVFSYLKDSSVSSVDV